MLQDIHLPYPKVRDLNTIFRNRLDQVKVNAILRYLERANKIEIDLDGNIIWMSSEKNRQSSLVEKAFFSPDFIGHLKSRNIKLSSNENV